MSIVLYLHIGSNCQEIQTIQTLKIMHKINEHGVLLFKALVDEKTNIQYIINIKAFEAIEIAIGDKEHHTPLFSGIVKKASIKHIKKVYHLSITAFTGSYFLDIKKKSCSFQNIEQSYYSLFKGILENYDNGDIIDQASNQEKLGKMVIQYKETDWTFLKRMASHFHATIVPSLIYNSPKVIIGKPIGEDRGKIEKFNYYVSKDLEYYLISKDNGNKDFKELDSVAFHIETTENFEIGDSLTYIYEKSEKGIAKLYIKEKEIEMIGGVLQFRYSLCTKGGFTTSKIYNEQIIGLSLKGKVLACSHNTIKVQLEIDKQKQNKNIAWSFPYTTPYSAGKNGGWYIMPELDDDVFIYFPDKKEHHAIATGSVRENNEDEKFNPDEKYLRTADGKEIKLTSEKIILTCSNWINQKTGEANQIYIELDEEEGITIQSTKPIRINSDSNIYFTAENNIILEADDEIKLRCQSSMIKMKSDIEIVGSTVKIN